MDLLELIGDLLGGGDAPEVDQRADYMNTVKRKSVIKRKNTNKPTTGRIVKRTLDGRGTEVAALNRQANQGIVDSVLKSDMNRISNSGAFNANRDKFVQGKVNKLEGNNKLFGFLPIENKVGNGKAPDSFRNAWSDEYDYRNDINRRPLLESINSWAMGQNPNQDDIAEGQLAGALLGGPILKGLGMGARGIRAANATRKINKRGLPSAERLALPQTASVERGAMGGIPMPRSSKPGPSNQINQGFTSHGPFEVGPIPDDNIFLTRNGFMKHNTPASSMINNLMYDKAPYPAYRPGTFDNVLKTLLDDQWENWVE